MLLFYIRNWFALFCEALNRIKNQSSATNLSVVSWNRYTPMKQIPLVRFSVEPFLEVNSSIFLLSRNNQCNAGYWHSMLYYNGTVPRWVTKNKIVCGTRSETLPMLRIFLLQKMTDLTTFWNFQKKKKKKSGLISEGFFHLKIADVIFFSFQFL